MKDQPIVRWLAILYMYELMITAGIGFYLSADLPVFANFAERTGITLTSLGFSLICFLCAVAVPFLSLLRNQSHAIKRTFYIACGLPLAAFTVPYGIWLISNRTFTLLITVYINIFISFIIIAWATFRPKS